MTIQKTLKERGSRYGEFADNAEISQMLKQTMRSAKNWELLTYAQQEALEMVQHKISRMGFTQSSQGGIGAKSLPLPPLGD